MPDSSGAQDSLLGHIWRAGAHKLVLEVLPIFRKGHVDIEALRRHSEMAERTKATTTAR